MTPRKGRGGRANNNGNNQANNYINYNNTQYLAQYPQVPTDYDFTITDNNTYYYPDALLQQAQAQAQAQQQEQPQQQASPRSNEELNISVLRRHNPNITSILSLAPYVVVYTFSPVTQQWEKNGIEGTMFICQLAQGSYGEERYSVFVLNRRGLNNFDILLTDGENVEITDEFVILKADRESEVSGINNNNNNNNNGSEHIIGLWIFSEPAPNSTAETRKINAEVIKECATHAGRSMELAREATQQQQQQQQAYASVPMGRQISLKELFGQQRAQDDAPGGMPNGGTAWGHAAPSADQLPTSTAQAMSQPAGNVLTDLFLRAGLVNQVDSRL
jgi:Dcp1-like decapping family